MLLVVRVCVDSGSTVHKFREERLDILVVKLELFIGRIVHRDVMVVCASVIIVVVLQPLLPLLLVHFFRGFFVVFPPKTEQTRRESEQALSRPVSFVFTNQNRTSSWSRYILFHDINIIVETNTVFVELMAIQEYNVPSLAP